MINHQSVGACCLAPLLLSILSANVMAAKDMQEIAEALSLREGQVAQVEAILSDFEQQRAELREKYSGDRRAMRKEMRALGEALDESMAEVLDEEQMEQFTQLQEDRRSQMRGKWQERRSTQRAKGI